MIFWLSTGIRNEFFWEYSKDYNRTVYLALCWVNLTCCWLCQTAALLPLLNLSPAGKKLRSDTLSQSGIDAGKLDRKLRAIVRGRRESYSNWFYVSLKMLVKCIINCKGIAIRALIKIGSADLINYRSRADWCCCVLGYFFKSGIRGVTLRDIRKLKEIIGINLQDDNLGRKALPR